MRAIVSRPHLVDVESEPGRTRTCDPVVKSHLLYQLSYRPVKPRAVIVTAIQSKAKRRESAVCVLAVVLHEETERAFVVVGHLGELHAEADIAHVV
jgi:hypothetical protein